MAHDFCREVFKSAKKEFVAKYGKDVLEGLWTHKTMGMWEVHIPANRGLKKEYYWAGSADCAWDAKSKVMFNFLEWGLPRDSKGSFERRMFDSLCDEGMVGRMVESREIELFFDRFFEANPHLMQWNEIQKKIWMGLVRQSLVKSRDTILFLQFADFFRSYYGKYDRPPSEEEVKAVLEI